MKIMEYTFRASWNEDSPIDDYKYPRGITALVVADDEVEARRLLSNALPQYKLRLIEIKEALR